MTIGNGATVGAGSVITKDVAEQSLSFERAQQISKANYQRPQKLKNKRIEVCVYRRRRCRTLCNRDFN